MEDLSIETCGEILTTERIAHVAVVDDEGPYVTPVSYVMLGGNLFFRTGAGRRLDAMNTDPRVCVEVSRVGEDGGWQSVVGFGQARTVTDDAIAQEVVRELFSKYRDRLGSPLSRGRALPLPETAVIMKVALKSISGRSSGSWLSIPTRPGRL